MDSLTRRRPDRHRWIGLAAAIMIGPAGRGNRTIPDRHEAGVRLRQGRSVRFGRPIVFPTGWSGGDHADPETAAARFRPVRRVQNTQEPSMTPIESSTTTERIVRTLGLTVLFSVFSGWFIYDGYVRYPLANLKKAVESLDPVPDELPPINESINQTMADEWIADVSQNRRTRSEIIARLGAPGWESPDHKEIRYFGTRGVLGFAMFGDLVTQAVYEAGDKNDLEQKLLGFALLPVALGFVIQLVRVITTRVVLSDAGLKVRGRPVIPFDAMEAIDASRYRKKGFVELSYTHGGRKKSVRLDDYVIRDFHPIIREICERCNIENQVLPPNEPA
ncbi:MAG: hypothetical protein ACE5E6_11035 [Phycisphaerae bacterium]